MPGKKQKNKDRLDKYYYMAKEHGLRSRAAFKLVQINKKYGFLGKAKVLIDLCCAPGGWLQVSEKFMPMASIKIGIDLDAIKPVKGCMAIVGDITEDKVINQVKRELKHFEADVVLNDGAPNVGAQWNKDAYTQAELALMAFRFATKTLRKGGTFVTKVFRSADYNSLLWVLKQFFNKVEPFKPKASRSQSSETFIVCLGYIKPDVLDPKFLDPKHVFAETKDENSSQKISSLNKLMEKTKNRGGYDDDQGTSSFYKEVSLEEFIRSDDPYDLLKKIHKFAIDDKVKEGGFKSITPPKNIEEICRDVQVLGKRDLTTLLKYRAKVRKSEEKKVYESRRKEKEEKRRIEEENKGESDIEKENEEELERAIKK